MPAKEVTPIFLDSCRRMILRFVAAMRVIQSLISPYSAGLMNKYARIEPGVNVHSN